VIIKREVFERIPSGRFWSEEIPNTWRFNTYCLWNPDYAMGAVVDGANVFAIGPEGRVISYTKYSYQSRLRQDGVEVLEIPSSELSRGSCGPKMHGPMPPWS